MDEPPHFFVAVATFPELFAAPSNSPAAVEIFLILIGKRLKNFFTGVIFFERLKNFFTNKIFFERL
ncbi:MAG: hypothetical protein IJG80_00050 [Selenomonadaceae bacterium]|nr:hypothetical protein [Selenomonadaceae bacterium]